MSGRGDNRDNRGTGHLSRNPLGRGGQGDISRGMSLVPEGLSPAITTSTNTAATDHGPLPAEARDMDRETDMDAARIGAVPVTREARRFGHNRTSEPMPSREITESARNRRIRHGSQPANPPAPSVNRTPGSEIATANSSYGCVGLTPTLRAGALVIADLFEAGRVTEPTHERMREAVGQQLRNGLPEGAREALADAYRKQGKPVPEWVE